jgi:hypothetical protein
LPRRLREPIFPWSTAGSRFARSSIARSRVIGSRGRVVSRESTREARTSGRDPGRFPRGRGELVRPAGEQARVHLEAITPRPPTIQGLPLLLAATSPFPTLT